jgi:hypothetical protein
MIPFVLVMFTCVFEHGRTAAFQYDGDRGYAAVDITDTKESVGSLDVPQGYYTGRSVERSGGRIDLNMYDASNKQITHSEWLPLSGNVGGPST